MATWRLGYVQLWFDFFKRDDGVQYAYNWRHNSSISQFPCM
jgi:hypothetical protein